MSLFSFFAAPPLQGGGDNGGLFGVLFSGFGLVCWLAVFLLFVVGAWKMFVKAGQPGWAALIPIYDFYIILKIIGRPGWWLLLLLIPFVNIVVYVIVAMDLARSFGKSSAWGFVLLFLFNVIGFLLLGWGPDQYVGPAASRAVTTTS